MVRRRWRVGRAIALLLLAFLATLWGGPGISEIAETAEVDTPEVATAEWSTDTIRQRIETGDATEIRMHHPFGDLRIEAMGDDVISVVAVAQRHLEDPRAPKVRKIVEDGVLHVFVEFAHLEVMEHEAWALRRIDVALAVPKDLELTLSTSSDLLEVKRTEVPVALKTVSGSLVFEGFGDLDARTESGALRVRFYDTSRMKRASLSTSTGNVHVQFLGGAKATLVLTTTGRITSDFSTAVDRKAGSRQKRARIELGESGPEVSIESSRGDIQVEALLAPEGLTPPD